MRNDFHDNFSCGFHDRGDETFSFTLTNGAVTAVQVTETHGTRTSTHTDTIGATSTYAVGTDGTITETSIFGHTVETTIYTAAATAGQYTVKSVTDTYIPQGTATTALNVDPNDRAKFTIDTSGAVTAVQRVLDDGTTKAVTVGTGTTYSQLAAGYVLEVQTHGTRTSYEVYHDGNGDGVYTEIAHGSGSTVDLVGLQSQISASIHAVL
ncbi:hypothetical protein GTP46_21535 [Duganella sp. FT135W]|uniref:Uncharacterized protein n=1 Tax=Duganella flavida TaxID=2692175 RepID=A0A6L8KCU5_9BURK|nr:hypothetical protein [Duganella flavida]MYM25216.1 hypothetical protein [Duganella flavida]